VTGLALGVDLGTSGVRSAVLDDAGDLVSSARASYGPASDDYRDPERWWSAVSDCLLRQGEALKAAGRSMDEVSRIAVDGTSGSLVLTDSALAPVTRALMYNDTGFEAEAGQIAQHAPNPHIARGSGSALARALHLVAEDADNRARHLLHQADFVAARLIGRGGFSDVNNALKTGGDPSTGNWPDWMEALLQASLLPELLLPGDAIAEVSAEAAAQFGLSRGAVVHAGTTDSIAAFLAAAQPQPGAAVTSLGTTLAIKLYSDVRIDAPEVGLYAHRIGEGWLVGGASNTGGGVLKAFFSADDLAALSQQIDPDQPSELDYYPLPRPGERFPINDPTLVPRLDPRPADPVEFLHGLLEGMARIERLSYETLQDQGGPYPQEVITAGGGAQNAAWRQIRARVLGVPVLTVATTEASIGTAKLAQSGA